MMNVFKYTFLLLGSIGILFLVMTLIGAVMTDAKTKKIQMYGRVLFGIGFIVLCAGYLHVGGMLSTVVILLVLVVLSPMIYGFISQLGQERSKAKPDQSNESE